MSPRAVISSKPPTASDWRWLDKQSVNVGDHEQVALFCHLDAASAKAESVDARGRARRQG